MDQYSPVDHVHTTLETIVEFTLTAATSKHLGFDDKLVIP
jgi:hypothetical protein